MRFCLPIEIFEKSLALPTGVCYNISVISFFEVSYEGIYLA